MGTYRLDPLTKKASNAVLWFLFAVTMSKLLNKQIELTVTWDAMMIMRRHWNVCSLPTYVELVEITVGPVDDIFAVVRPLHLQNVDLKTR